MKEQYNLNRKNLKINMTPPSHFKEQMEQHFIETEFNNYSTLADRPEMSKYFLMKNYLHWDDEKIKENVEGFKKDKELGLKEEEEI
jgi:hypothetical protein